MKKLVALLLVLVFCLSLTACGTTTTPSASPAASSAAPATSAAPASESAAPATSAAPETLKIGVLANQTGWFASIDAGFIQEIQMYVKMINEEGGITIGDKVYNLELDIQDGQSDFTGIRNAAQILINDGVKYVVTTNDFWVDGSMDLFEAAGVMNMQSQNNWDVKAIGPDHPYSFTFQNGCAATYASEIKALVKNYPDVKSVVFVEGDDGMSAVKEPLIKALCEANGLEYIDKPVVYDQSQTDLAPVALQIIATGADALIGNGSPNNCGAILKELRANGSDMVYAATVGFPAGALIAVAGPEAADRAFTAGADTTTEANNSPDYWKYLQAYAKEYGAEAAANFNSYGINTLFILKQLFEGAKSVEVKDVIAYWEAQTTVKGLYGDYKVAGTKTFGNNHLVAAPDPISMLVEGKIVFGGWFESNID